MVGIEQAKLLASVHSVEGVVNLEYDPLRHLPERGAIEIDHRPPIATSSRTPGRFSSRHSVDCDARFRPGGSASWAILEDRIAAQPVGVVAVLVAGGDHLHANADHVARL